jgi:hypothetical protein
MVLPCKIVCPFPFPLAVEGRYYGLSTMTFLLSTSFPRSRYRLPDGNIKPCQFLGVSPYRLFCFSRHVLS